MAGITGEVALAGYVRADTMGQAMQCRRQLARFALHIGGEFVGRQCRDIGVARVPARDLLRQPVDR